MTTNKSTLPAIAFALAALSIVPSHAIARDAGPTQQVSYADLDLTNPAGVEMLDRRLDRAVKRVCGNPGRFPLTENRRNEKCHEDTWNNIESQRQVAIARASERRDGIGLAQRSTYELPVVASAR